MSIKVLKRIFEKSTPHEVKTPRETVDQVLKRFHFIHFSFSRLLKFASLCVVFSLKWSAERNILTQNLY